MKKIVVVTECRRFAFNYGETLQAVALNRVISKLGYNCTTASYEDQRSAFNLWFKQNLKKYGITALKFELFRIKYMNNLMKRSSKKEEFYDILKDAAAVVCGSDCIWYEKCYNSVLFLNFPKIHIPKIAYAPSLRDDIVNNVVYKQRVARWLKDFRCISTRERGGSKIIEEISGRSVTTVLDPTFLISQNEWNQMCGKGLIKTPYILIYLLGKTRCMEDIVRQIQQQYAGRKIIWIKMEKNDGYFTGDSVANIGPAEFISLIRYAEVVLTDSFHGTVFSIIYQKPLYVVKRIVDSNDIYDHDCRIKNIFDILGIENYYLSDEKIDFSKSVINYGQVYKKLTTERNKSLLYL